MARLSSLSHLNPGTGESGEDKGIFLWHTSWGCRIIGRGCANFSLENTEVLLLLPVASVYLARVSIAGRLFGYGIGIQVGAMRRGDCWNCFFG